LCLAITLSSCSPFYPQWRKTPLRAPAKQI
jgi:hypothetical protein